ncbi:C4 protein [Sesame curly top virus]|uniref:C4 protein n=1 Tax=Sesame curly top virus TaxID=2487726 RepID=A0A3S5H8B5_9GEMI|nr:C4 protein [Sesame curly top virus]AYV61075.1 C4 protein [Sesame curly top virus]AYV61081.1 C4 protein [Sesame curly top virus]AYV61087.1 C4 protein [Sesame curly top virus]AYV61093.1 C4 protein [Sesame curly top virus]
MGSLISTCLYSSKERSSSVTPVISTYGILMPVETSIQISRELNPAPMSSPISRRTEITSTGVNFRSMEDLQEEVSRRLMTHVRRH